MMCGMRRKCFEKRESDPFDSRFSIFEKKILFQFRFSRS